MQGSELSAVVAGMDPWKAVQRTSRATPNRMSRKPVAKEQQLLLKQPIVSWVADLSGLKFAVSFFGQDQMTLRQDLAVDCVVLGLRG